jgi:flagellar hook-associated protein 2
MTTTATVGSNLTASSTGVIQSQGIGSGLNVNAIVSSLMSVENIPLTNLQTAASGIQTTISTYGAVQSAMSTFDSAALALTQPSLWAGTLGTSTNTNAVTVSTASGATAANYSIQTQNLAAAQSTVSPTFSSSSALVGSGTLHVDLGTWSAGQTGFKAQTGSSGVDITVSATDTVATLAQKINSANAGVSAAIITDATGARLVLTSSTTGAANGFRVTTADSDGNNTDASGLSALAYDPASGTASTSLTQSATNANATINGLAVNSATNTLSNLLPGLTINLLQPTSGPVQINVAQNAGSIQTAINSFVTAYNGLTTLLNTDTAYNATTSTAGPLQGDSAVITLQRQLRNIVGGSSTASSAFSTLSQAGIQIQPNGTLAVNSSTLTNAMANAAQIQALFAGMNASSPANAGFAQQFVALGNSVTDPTTGLLTTRVAGLNTSLTNNQADQSGLQTRLAATQAMLQKQYTALDTQMAGLTATSTFVTQQIALWNNPNSTS